VFTKLDSGVQFHALCADGDKVSVGTVAFTVETNAHTLLGAERLVLNVMQHLSGIATTTHQLVQALEGTGCRVLDTRKTIPLNRILEKWAVRVGGGVNHRFGLFDQVLIKDNHIDAVGDIRATLRRCRAELDRMGVDVPIVVECRTLAHVQVAVETGIPHRLLLDNMSPTQLKEAVQWVNGRLPLEASGGITPENARQYAETGVDFLSMGALTHTVKPLDISLKIQS
jgi:nicotinate-nucleotide pyrophosphorylase (carboxylating)